MDTINFLPNISSTSLPTPPGPSSAKKRKLSLSTHRLTQPKSVRIPSASELARSRANFEHWLSGTCVRPDQPNYSSEYDDILKKTWMIPASFISQIKSAVLFPWLRSYANTLVESIAQEKEVQLVADEIQFLDLYLPSILGICHYFRSPEERLLDKNEATLRMPVDHFIQSAFTLPIKNVEFDVDEEVSLSMMISSNGGPVGNTAIVDTAAFIVKTGFFNKVPSKDLYRAATAATCLGTPNTAVLQILHLPAEYKVDDHPARQLYYDLGAGQHQRRCLGLSDGPLFGLTVDRLAVRVYVSWWEQDLILVCRVDKFLLNIPFHALRFHLFLRQVAHLAQALDLGGLSPTSVLTARNASPNIWRATPEREPKSSNLPTAQGDEQEGIGKAMDNTYPPVVHEDPDSLPGAEDREQPVSSCTPISIPAISLSIRGNGWLPSPGATTSSALLDADPRPILLSAARQTEAFSRYRHPLAIESAHLSPVGEAQRSQFKVSNIVQLPVHFKALFLRLKAEEWAQSGVTDEDGHHLGISMFGVI